MFIRIFFGLFFLAGVTGCATTQNKAMQQDQVQARVTELEKKLEEKDAEIVDLQYEVKDLSGKVDSSRNFSDPEPVAAPVAVKGGDEIIRVAVSPEQIQQALKAAGTYAGKVDGKIGAGTKAAIVAFQKSQGLAADGVVGRKTWDALKTYLQ